MIVAHQTLPCRTRLIVCLPRQRRCVRVKVMDRGPLHAAIDMSRGVARALRHNGKEPVVWFVLQQKPRLVAGLRRLAGVGSLAHPGKPMALLYRQADTSKH